MLDSAAMKITAILALFLTLAVQAAPAQKVQKPETSHLVFVTEYIRELSELESIRDSGEQELKADSTNFSSSIIHSGTLFQLELGSQIRTLNGMSLKAPLDWLIPNLIGYDKEKLVIWRRMTEIGTAFMEGPKPGVDYSKLGAEMPQLRAGLEYIDKGLMQVSVGVFGALIDLKPDSKGHASHLIITKAERSNLVDRLNIAFGSKLDQKDQNLLVSAATVLRGYLLKDFKCSDEPWE
jgi:hypothetical protein